VFAERASAHLAAFERRALPDEARRRAAVAILVSPHEGELTYVLTRRALTLRRNAGNWALPGGGVDPGEDAAMAALRETHEELGVMLAGDAVLGLLDDFVTLGEHVVTPVVLWSAHELTFAPNEAEVSQVFRLPLTQLDDPRSPRFVAREGGPPILQMRAGDPDHFINAPTAAWLYQFREVAMHGRWTRLDNIGQPEWTAR
jgi:8-oxo-dGTP pyrophosphatase MutT (NUDIX family)